VIALTLNPIAVRLSQDRFDLLRLEIGRRVLVGVTHGDRAVGEADIPQIEAHELTDAKPRAICQRDHRV
jgi:hypothetical protein